MISPVVYRMNAQDKTNSLVQAAMGLSEAPSWYKRWLEDWHDPAELPGWRWSGCRTESDAIDLARARLDLLTREYPTSRAAAAKDSSCDEGSAAYDDDSDDDGDDHIRHPLRASYTALLWACAGPQACDYVGGHPKLLLEAFVAWSMILHHNYRKHLARVKERQRWGLGDELDLESFGWGVFRPAAHALIGVRMLRRWVKTPMGHRWKHDPNVSTYETTRVRVAVSQLIEPMAVMWAYLHQAYFGDGRSLQMSERAAQQAVQDAWTTVAPVTTMLGFEVGSSGDVDLLINCPEVATGVPRIVLPPYYTHGAKWREFVNATENMSNLLEMRLSGTNAEAHQPLRGLQITQLMDIATQRE